MHATRGKMDTNIQKYQAFLETVKLGSFTRAAQALSYSQSGVSRMVADLERDWGLRLLIRNRGGVTLTPDGRRMLSRVQALCADYQRMENEVSDIRGVGSGVIRIGTFSSVATHWLPRIISRFQHDYPAVDYELLMGDYVEIERWVAMGNVDCGFIGRMPRDSSLSYEELAKDELLAIVPEGHELASHDEVTLHDLCSEPFLLLRKGTDDAVSSVFDGAPVKPDVHFVTWDDYAIMSMVESGLGLAVLPSLILRRNPYHILPKHLAEPRYRSICCVHRDPQLLSRVAERFLSYVPLWESGVELPEQLSETASEPVVQATGEQSSAHLAAPALHRRGTKCEAITLG